jgi:hypothetical protein
MKSNKKSAEKDYKAIFLMGITFIGVGVVFMATINPGLGGAFMGIGCLFMIIGGKNKDKWKK